MSVYIDTTIVAPPYYDKRIFVYTAFTSPMKILGRDNRRVKVIVSMETPFLVTNPIVCFDGSDRTSGSFPISAIDGFSMNWTDFYSLVQSEMWIVGINSGTRMVVTTIVAQNTKRERSRDAIDTIRLATEKISSHSWKRDVITSERQPIQSIWQR